MKVFTRRKKDGDGLGSPAAAEHHPSASPEQGVARRNTRSQVNHGSPAQHSPTAATPQSSPQPKPAAKRQAPEQPDQPLSKAMRASNDSSQVLAARTSPRLARAQTTAGERLHLQNRVESEAGDASSPVRAQRGAAQRQQPVAVADASRASPRRPARSRNPQGVTAAAVAAAAGPTASTQQSQDARPTAKRGNAGDAPAKATAAASRAASTGAAAPAPARRAATPTLACSVQTGQQPAETAGAATTAAESSRPPAEPACSAAAATVKATPPDKGPASAPAVAAAAARAEPEAPATRRVEGVQHMGSAHSAPPATALNAPASGNAAAWPEETAGGRTGGISQLTGCKPVSRSQLPAPATMPPPPRSSRGSRPIGMGRLPGAPPPAPGGAGGATHGSALNAGGTSPPSKGTGAPAAGAAGPSSQQSQQQQQQVPGGAARRNGAPGGSRPSGGRASGGAGAAAQVHGSQDSAAHSIVEAQERGELLRMQDDATYALDGLVPTSSLPTQRESAMAVAEILATRRGRAALRAENLAQQVLTALARLRPQRDPPLSLCCGAVLLALAQDDALPAYLASWAAAVLMSQLLQVEPPLDLAAATLEPADTRPPGAAGAAGAGGGGVIVPALAALGNGSGGAAAADDSGVTRRVARLLSEGQLARQVGRPAMVASHLPVVLLAMVKATSTAPARAQFAERIKTNLHKLDVLAKLGGLVLRCKQRLEQELRPPAAAAAAAEGRQPEAQPSVHAVASDAVVAAAAAATAEGPGQEPQEAAAALGGGDAAAEAARDPWAFEESQDAPPAAAPELPGSAPAAAADAAAAGAGCSTPSAAATAEEPRQEGLSVLRSALMWDLHLCLMALENATFAHKANEARVLSMRLGPGAAAAGRAAAAAAGGGGGALVAPPSPSPPPQQQADAQQQPSAAAAAAEGESFVQVLVELVQLLAPHLGAGPAVRDCCQTAVAVLMNITHEHPEGVAAVAAAGGLRTAGEMIWRCCQPKLASQQHPPGAAAAAAAAGEGSGAEAAACMLVSERSTIIAWLEVASVAMGLLINMTSSSSENQAALREVPLLEVQQQMLSLQPGAGAGLGAPGAVLQPEQHPGSCASGAGAGSEPMDVDGIGRVDCGGEAAEPLLPAACRMVPLLCSVYNALAPPPPPAAAAAPPGPASKAPAGLGACTGGEPGGRDDVQVAGDAGREGDPDDAAAAARRVSDAGEEVTEHHLSNDQQEGHASIVQVYSTILLGYLVAGCPQVAAQARSLLAGGSLAPVAEGIQRCLSFYVQAGAITDVSREALVKLLAALVAQEQAYQQRERAGAQQAEVQGQMDTPEQGEQEGEGAVLEAREPGDTSGGVQG